MRRLLLLLPLAAALILVSSAQAQPPALSSVTVSPSRHPSAQFSAPKADSVFIYFASKPDRATDGSFYQENVVAEDSMTTDEIQAGSWTYTEQLDPGTYYVMLDASPSFDQCYIVDTGTFDPSCADGYSNVVTLTVPVPPIRYSTHVKVFRYSGVALLSLTATPLGISQPYRVCYRSGTRRRCVSGTLDGYSWDASTDDQVSVSTRKLAARTTFIWYVGSRVVAKKHVKIPQVG